MGHRRAAILVSCALLALCALTGCGKKAGDEGSAPVPQSFSVLEGEAARAAADQAKTAITSQLALPDGSADELQTVSVTQFGDETVVRCAQTWRGVEIYGSSLLSADGADGYRAGTYYDLTGVFGDDFDALAAQAAQVPDWMTEQTADGVTVSYDTSTLRPVIYVDDETGAAALARCFDVTISGSVDDVDTSILFEVVTDLNGEIRYSLQDYSSGFQEDDLSKGGVSIPGASQDGQYFAYDMGRNYFVFHLFAENKTQLSRCLDNYTGGKPIAEYIFSTGSPVWEGTQDSVVFDTMRVFNSVSDWYRDSFGYVGIDGQGGTAVLVTNIPSTLLGSVAMNGGPKGYLTLARRNVIYAPEIMAHEYGHAVMKNICSLQNLNESAALHEGLADVFACLYLADQGDDSWRVGFGAGSGRDVAGSTKTMDDYRYDKLSDTPEFTHRAGSLIFSKEDWEFVISAVRGKRSDTVSTKQGHENGLIVSHALYRIWCSWTQQLGKSSDFFATTLFRSLRYLPGNADLADFRQAFIQATFAGGGGQEAIDAAAASFDEAKISNDSTLSVRYAMELLDTSDTSTDVPVPAPTDVPVPAPTDVPLPAPVEVVPAPAEVPGGLTAMDYLDMTYDQLCQQSWDSFDYTDSPDDPSSWWCFASQGSLSYTFTYYFTPLCLPEAQAWGVSVYAFAEPGMSVQTAAVMPGVSTGMTYEQIAAQTGAPAPGYDYEYGDNVSRLQTADGYLVILFFDGTGASSVLYGANIWAPAVE